MTRNLLSLATDVLARPRALVDEIVADPHGGRVVPGLLALILAGGALFGLAVGTYHGGIQMALAAVKMPAVLLAPLLVTLPALRVVYRTEKTVDPWLSGVAALVGTARAAVLASALVPVVWLVYSVGPSYRFSALFMVAALALAGLPGLVTVAQVLSGGRHRVPIAGILLCGLVIGQTGWILRPFVVTPGARVTTLCPIQDDVFSGLLDRAFFGVSVGVDGQADDCQASVPGVRGVPARAEGNGALPANAGSVTVPGGWQ